jgi:hypothetical protein
MCAVTALGDYNYKLGGHLVLWECKLVLEFPPGATVLLPSACISHSNIPIQANESRYSFTQYSAGSLFRFVDQNFMKKEDFMATLSPQQQIVEEFKSSSRLYEGLSLLSTYTVM